MSSPAERGKPFAFSVVQDEASTVVLVTSIEQSRADLKRVYGYFNLLGDGRVHCYLRVGNEVAEEVITHSGITVEEQP